MRQLFLWGLLFTALSVRGQGLNELLLRDPHIVRLHQMLTNRTPSGWGTWKDFIKRNKSGKKDIISINKAIIFDSSLKDEVEKILVYVRSIPIDSTQAVTDIRSNHIRLFCGLSFAPEAMMNWDRAFEQLFDLQYSVVGDAPIYSPHEMISYNRIIAAYLDRKYGAVWRSTIRRDVLGINREHVD